MMYKKWKTIVALVPMIIAIVMQWWWFFTFLFILQIIFSLQIGSIEYVEEVKKTEHPFLFWFIIILWSVLALYSIRFYFQ